MKCHYLLAILVAVISATISAESVPLEPAKAIQAKKEVQKYQPRRVNKTGLRQKTRAKRMPFIKPITTRIVEDGVQVQGPGIFTAGCYYGEDESSSDHGPVVYGKFATWNVAGPISHHKIVVDPGSKPFFNHKFFTDADGNLINRQGGKARGFLGTSESISLKSVYNSQKVKNLIEKTTEDGEVTRDPSAVLRLLKKGQQALSHIFGEEDEATTIYLEELFIKAQNEVNNPAETKFFATLQLLSATERGFGKTTYNYIQRMERVVAAIKKIFTEKGVDYMVVQEVPIDKASTLSGEDIQSLIKEMFEDANATQQLTISFVPKSRRLETKIGKTAFKKGMIPDVGIVQRVGSKPLKPWAFADFDNRLAAWCTTDKANCYVAAHMPFTSTDAELKIRCEDIANFSQKLSREGAKTIQIAGDFNTDASRFSSVCERALQIPKARVELHTTDNEAGNSCGSNDGHLSEKNIDIMIRYQF